MIAVVVALVAALTMGGVQAGELYRCADGAGRIVYQDAPCKRDSAERAKIVDGQRVNVDDIEREERRQRESAARKAADSAAALERERDGARREAEAERTRESAQRAKPQPPRRPTYTQVIRGLESDYRTERGTDRADEPRRIGMSHDKLSIIEILGPDDSVHRVSMVLALPEGSRALRNVALLLVLLKNIAPDWSNGPNWIAENLSEAIAGREPATSYANVAAKLRVVKSLGLVATFDIAN